MNEPDFNKCLDLLRKRTALQWQIQALHAEIQTIEDEILLRELGKYPEREPDKN